MKNIKTALSLALLAVAPTIYAQNTDTKAPAEPGFMVTLNVTNNGGGLDSVLKGNDKDSLILNGTNSTSVLYNSNIEMYLKANSQYKLKEFKVNGKAQTLEASFGAGARYAGVNSYKYTPTSTSLKEKTDIAITWEEKPEVVLVITGAEQMVKDNTAATLTITADGETISNIEYYTDITCKEQATNDQRKLPGTFYVPIKKDETTDKKGVDKVVTMVVSKKVEVAVSENAVPKTDGEFNAGQTLSAVAITGGTVTVKDQSTHTLKGTWAWANPNAILTPDATDGYDAIFTPDSAAYYQSLTQKVKVAVKHVSTVTVEQVTGGTVVIENATPDNKYVGTTSVAPDVTATATPAKGYKFVRWVTPTTSNQVSEENKETVQKATFSKIADGTVVKAEFAKATRTVKLASISNGTVEVLNGDSKLDLTGGKSVEYGTALTIVATPNDGKEVETVGYKYGTGGTQVAATNFIVGGDFGGEYEVSATFKDKPAEKKMVTVTPPFNGSITMLTGTDGQTVVNPNSSVAVGTVVTVIAMPNKGYKLSKLLAGTEDITGKEAISIKADTDIRATFVKESYPVTITAPAEVEISGVTTTDGKAEYETIYPSVSAKVKDPDHYKLVSLLVNNRSVTNGSAVTIEGATTFSAQVQELTPVNILNEANTVVVYDGKTPTYAVKTAAGLGNFNVKFYKEGAEVTPLNVGEYDVHISRKYDDLYATYDNSTSYKLTIKAGVPGIKKIAVVDDNDMKKVAENSGEATVAGDWTTTRPNDRPAAAQNSLKSAVETTTIFFVPADGNIGYLEATTVKKSAAAKDPKTVTITNNSANGTVSLMNGTMPVTEGTVFANLTFTAAAKADKGFKVDWTKITVNDKPLSATNQKVTATENLTIVVASDAFVAKDKPSFETLDLSVFYSTKSLAQSISDLKLDNSQTWSIMYGKQGTEADNILFKTDSPIEAGIYTIYASCDESEKYVAVEDEPIGTLEIKKAALTNDNVVAPIAEPLAVGADLSSSLLSGGEVKYNGIIVPGDFTWKKTEAIDKAGDQKVIFTPQDQVNYDVSNLDIKSYVSLVGVRSFVMSTDAKVVITDAQDKVITSGDKVPVGMKLYIAPISGTIETVSVNVKGAQSGSENVEGGAKKWYCIAPASDFTITVTFKSGSEGEGGDTPEEGVAVTGISLNKTTLTLPRLKSEKLVATVTPTGATKKDVKWTSTNPEIATVDADGTVKAVKYGQATIIATTVDGGFTAMCQVNVDFATAIEKILSESLVYSRNGQIIIEPAAPVEISIINLGGQVIYNNSISSTVQVPTNNGVYIVRMAAAGKATTTKVIVR